MTFSPRAIIGEFAGRYTIERELGRGGTSIVYLAQETGSARAVAIKVLRTELVTEISTERFLREIRVTSELRHPGIVPVLDSGEYDTRLFFVLPLMDGGTLRARFDREKQLPIGDVVDIGQAVAEALQFAHERNVLHRDVKPENILFTGGRACLADFGIARALTRASDSRTTSTGIVRGTPAYMSPEQASGDDNIDARSDLYSLACVLYEALAGVPAFVGPTPQSIVAQRLGYVPRGVRMYRPSAPVGLERVLERALALSPADRYQTSREFGDALGESMSILAEGAPAQGTTSEAWRGRTTAPLHRRARIAIGAIAVVGLLAWGIARFGAIGHDRLSGGERGASGQVTLDTTRYAILPFEYDSSVKLSINETQFLRDALARWRGVDVADQFQVRDASRVTKAGPLSVRDAEQVAERVGAGRYVRGRVTFAGDSTRVSATLYDTRSGRALYQSGMKLTPALARAESAWSALADTLLFRGMIPGSRENALLGSKSLPALQAFVRGDEGIHTWDLARADSAFAEAIQFDPEYAKAYLWLAQVRAWNRQPTARWSIAAEQAKARRNSLTSRDQLLSDALFALNRGQFEQACPIWSGLAANQPNDFAAWYGLGTCLRGDSAVVRDGASPSGWRFRAGYHSMLQAYERAFRLLPSIHRSFRQNSYISIRALLKTSISLRAGHAVPPDTMSFLAYPSWSGDSLSFIPYLAQDVRSGSRQFIPPTLDEALSHQRRMFYSIATGWAAANPTSADAREAVAVALELLGNPSALDTLRLATSLALEPDERLRLQISGIWMRFKFYGASNLKELRKVQVEADSLVRSNPLGVNGEPRLIAGLAALLGHASLAAAYARDSRVVKEWATPDPLVDIAPPLRVFAAFGGPVDSLRLLESRFETASRVSLSSQSQQTARLQWMLRAASLSLPYFQFASLASLAGNRFPVIDAQVALMRRDTARARQIMRDRREVLQAVRPADRKLDVLLPEAFVLLSLGDTASALQWLKPTLDALAGTAPQVFVDPDQAAALVRSMALVAELSASQGDLTTSRAWSRVVIELWSSPDDFLKPISRRMQQLAR